MAILKASKQIYEFTLDDMKALIASDLGVPASAIDVSYVEGDVGPSDPMDRFPTPRGIVSVSVTVNNEKYQRPAKTNSLAEQIAAVESLDMGRWDR